jgi:hypothetical protein
MHSTSEAPDTTPPGSSVQQKRPLGDAPELPGDNALEPRQILFELLVGLCFWPGKPTSRANFLFLVAEPLPEEAMRELRCTKV